MNGVYTQKVEMKQIRKRGRYVPFLPRAVLGLCIIHPLLPIKTLPRLSFRFNTPYILVLESMLASYGRKGGAFGDAEMPRFVASFRSCTFVFDTLKAMASVMI
jgi:hypothetical protein